MAIKLYTGNRAIDRFQASQQIDNAERRAETADFERQRQAQQAYGADRGLREFVAGLNQPAPPASAAPIVPQPAATPAPVAPTQAPATAKMPEIFAPNTAQTGSPMPQATVTPGGQPAAPVQADIVKPASNITPNVPAITAAVSAPPAISNFSAGMQRLSQVPGTGSAMAQFHGQEQARQERSGVRDQTNARQKQAAEIQLIKSMHDGQPDMAEAIAKQYNINIPPEVLKSAKFRSETKWRGDEIKRRGITDDAAAASIEHKYLTAKQGGADDQTAWAQAWADVKPAAKAPKRIWSDRLGTWVEEPTSDNPTGRVSQPPGATPRPVRPAGGGRAAGTGGKGSAFVQKYNLRRQIATGESEEQSWQKVSAENGVKYSDLISSARAIHAGAGKNFKGQSTMSFRDAMAQAGDLAIAQKARTQQPAVPAAAAAPGGRPPLSSFER